MPIRKEVLNFPLTKEDVAVLNEALEDLSHGVDDERVRDNEPKLGISTKKLRFNDLGEMTVGTSQVVGRHDLDVVPHFVVITMKTGGTIYESDRADKSRIYLTADAADLKAHVVVFA
jgi:hypothetical protein